MVSARVPEFPTVQREAFTITLRSIGFVRQIVATSEREAALAAESIVRLEIDRPGGIGFVIDADPRASRRIAAYLSDVMAEMAQPEFLA